MRLFASLSKVEEQDDGSIKVHGFASSGARDDAGEIILPQAMKDALPDYMKWGAIREMHGPSAAGTALEASVDEDGFTHLVAHVVDPVAISKVKSNTYKGFSIGGKVLKRDPNDRSIITAIKLVETSLVDRPCNPEASINMWKAADIADPEGEVMSEVTQPTNDEVKARAAEMAKAAGKPDRANDYLAKAREELVAKAAETAAEVQSGAVEGAAAETVEQTPEAAVAKVDPAEALAKALDGVIPAAEPAAVDPVTPGLADLGKGLSKLGELYAEDPMRKGWFYGIGMLAEAVSTLVSVQSNAASDALYSPSGDTQQAPQLLAEACQAAGQAMLQYVKETLADAMAQMQAGGAELDIVVVDGDEAFALAVAAVDLVKADTALMEKAGKRNSAKDQKHVQDAHDSAVKAGAKCDKDNVEKAAEPEDLAKVTAERDRYAEALEKAVAPVEELKKRLAALEAQPMPSKTAGSSHAVSKVGDAGAGEVVETAVMTTEQVQKALDALPEGQRVDLLMRAALSRGTQLSL